MKQTVQSSLKFWLKRAPLLMVVAVFAIGCGGKTAPSPEAVAATPEAEVQSEPAPTKASVQPKKAEGPKLSVFSLNESNRAFLSPDKRFSLGLDRLVREDFARLNHRRICVVTSRLAIDSNGQHLLETLLPKRDPIVTRVVFFDDELPSPARNEVINKLLATYPEVRVFSRSDTALSLTDVMLEETDVVLVDLPYRGYRMNPEFVLFGNIMQECHKRSLDLMILDRPIPITGGLVSGPTGTAETFNSREAFFPVPVVPGLTLGEFALMYNQEFGLEMKIDVVPMIYWNRFKGASQLMETYEKLGITPWERFEEWDSYYATDQRFVERMMTQQLLEGLTVFSSDQSALELPAPTENTEAFIKNLKEYTKPFNIEVSLEGSTVSMINTAVINPVEWAFAVVLATEGTSDKNFSETLLTRLAATEYAPLMKPGVSIQQLRQAWAQNQLQVRFTLKRQGYFLYTGF